MKTQIAFSDNLNKGKLAALTEQAKRLGAIRTEVWKRFGSIKGIGLRESVVRTIVHEAVNKVIDKANVIVTEDLTSPIVGKKFGKNVIRRLSSWTKGVIASAIENISHRRGSTVIYVNAAYTSQMDSCDGSLSGKRSGEKFYRENGEVLQADVNAARNVLARLYDSEISRWMPYKQVKAILLQRMNANRLKLLNQDFSCRLQNILTESELSNEYVCI